MCGGSAVAVEKWCCGKVVLNNFCVQCGQSATAAVATNTASSLIGEDEEVVVIKKENKEAEQIYIID